MKPLNEIQMRHDRIAAAHEETAIVRLHKSNAAITELEIAGKLGLTEYGVRWLLMDRGFEPRYSTPQEIRKRQQADMGMRAAQLYRSGLSLREVADKFRLSQEAIRKILAKRGVKRRPAGQWTKRNGLVKRVAKCN